MCFQKNKKLILLLIFVFIIIYLLTKHNEHFDEKLVANYKSNYRINKASLSKDNKNSLLDKFEIKNSSIQNTRMMGSEIMDSYIKNPTINNANINNLSTTGRINFTSEKKDGNITNQKEVFTLLSDPNTPDQLFIKVDGRSGIDFFDNSSYIRIGDQTLNRDKLEFLNKLHDRETQTSRQPQEEAQMPSPQMPSQMPPPQMPPPQMPSQMPPPQMPSLEMPSQEMSSQQMPQMPQQMPQQMPSPPN
jgi:hypothetical protein